MYGTNAGPVSPIQTDVTPTENSAGRCAYCENVADGVDANRCVQVCRRCADLLPDREVAR